MVNLRETGKNVLKNTNINEHKRGDDTIRIWEGYRQQAVMWRALSIMQLLATTAVSILCIILWQTRQVVLNVPQRPVPGQYNTQEIPDADLIEAATTFVNLIATFQPYTAKAQFERAGAYVHDEYYQKFTDETLGSELKAIIQTSLSQVFYIDPSKTTVERNKNNTVIVHLYGVRHKYISGEEREPVKSMYEVFLTTLPRNELNPLGIVVYDSNLQIIEN